jgi:hypothetical protein
MGVAGRSGGAPLEVVEEDLAVHGPLDHVNDGRAEAHRRVISDLLLYLAVLEDDAVDGRDRVRLVAGQVVGGVGLERAFDGVVATLFFNSSGPSTTYASPLPVAAMALLIAARSSVDPFPVAPNCVLALNIVPQLRVRTCVLTTVRETLTLYP